MRPSRTRMEAAHFPRAVNRWAAGEGIGTLPETDHTLERCAIVQCHLHRGREPRTRHLIRRLWWISIGQHDDLEKDVAPALVASWTTTTFV